MGKRRYSIIPTYIIINNHVKIINSWLNLNIKYKLFKFSIVN